MGRFEFDPSWVVIRCLAAVGLAETTGLPVQLPTLVNSPGRVVALKQ
jgi:fatty-acid desaturase